MFIYGNVSLYAEIKHSPIVTGENVYNEIWNVRKK